MGNFYTNVALVGPDREAVLAALREEGRSAWISPTRRRVTVVYDESCEDQDVGELSALARRLSRQLDCTAVAALNHDDDALYLELHEQGRCTASWLASSEEFDEAIERRGGAPDFCRALARPLALPLLTLVMALPLVFEIFRHVLIAWLLGIPPRLVITGYTYIDQEDLPFGLGRSEFEHT